MIHNHIISNRSRGLAPLEMVLAIPILLGIMALMVNIANVACWKVRALTVSRHAIWGNLSPLQYSPWVPYNGKTGYNDPRPADWNAKQTSDSPNSLGQATGVTDFETPRQEVVRGQSDANPIFQAGGKSIVVNADLLDPSRGMREGGAHLTHPYPMLKCFGSFHTQAKTEILDDSWRVAEMGLPNDHFRLNIIYPAFQPPGSNNPVLPIILNIYKSIYGQGLMSLLYGTDPDFQKFQMRYGVAPPLIIHSIIGSTGLKFSCSMDQAIVEQAVDDLVERISGAKKRNGPLMVMASSLKGYYKSVEGAINALQQATPPPSGAQTAQMQADLDLLDGYIKLLDEFMGSL